MIHFQGHDDVHGFLLRLVQRAEDEAQSDLSRCRSDWSIEEAKNWLEKVQTAKGHLTRCMMVDREHIRVSWMQNLGQASTLVKASVHISTKAGFSDGLRPEAFYRAVSEVETSVKEYLFEPPQVEEQTPPDLP